MVRVMRKLYKIDAMDTYTMTFVNKVGLGLSPGSFRHYSQVKQAVLEKLFKHEFILADFNWAENYDPNNIKIYLEEPYHCNTVIEMRLDLDVHNIRDRSAIYERCLTALGQDEIFVKRSEEFLDNNCNQYKNLITFDAST